MNYWIRKKERLKTHFVLKSRKILEIHLESTASKSRTRSLVSSVPLRDPTAQTNLVALARMRHTTPPLPPLSSATRSRINSPVKHHWISAQILSKNSIPDSPFLTSQSLTVPSSEDVITNFELNWRHVTADWCLLGPKEQKIISILSNVHIASDVNLVVNAIVN